MTDVDPKAKKLLSRVGFALCLMVITIFIVQIILLTGFRIISPKFSERNAAVFLTLAISVAIGGIPVFYLLTKGLPDSKKGEIIKVKWTQMIGYFMISAAFMYISNIIGSLINAEIASLKGDVQLNDPIKTLMNGEDIIPTFAYVIIIGPILEEVIFRKILLDKIGVLGDIPAILLSGIAFGLFHMNLAQFFYATVLGFIFAYITLRTNTIRYAVILHMMINSVGVIASLFIDNIVAMFIMGMWIIAAIAIGLVLFFIKSKELKFDFSKNPVQKKSVYFLNLGTILYVVTCSIVMVVSIIFN